MEVFDDEEESGPARAFLLVRRHVKDKRPLEGKETRIIIELYNSGNE